MRDKTAMNHISTIDAESQNLEIHVDLCAQRYTQMDGRLTVLEKKVDDLGDRIDRLHSDIWKVMITTAGTIVVAVIGAIGMYLTR